MNGHKPLNMDELIDLITQVREQTTSIAAFQAVVDMARMADRGRPHEDAYIYQALHNRASPEATKAFAPVERWAHGEDLEFPNKSSFMIGGTLVSVTATHRGPAEQVYGVDVFHEIGRKKVAAFQHKKLDREGVFLVDEAQLKNIRKTCNACPEKLPRTLVDDLNTLFFRPKRFRQTGYMKPACSAMYVINDPNNGKQGLLSACMLKGFRKRCRDNPHEIDRLIGRETVDESFVKCLLGYELEDASRWADNLKQLGGLDDDLVFRVFIGPTTQPLE